MRDIDKLADMLRTRKIDFVIMPEDNDDQTIRLVAKTRRVEGYAHFYADFYFGPDGNLFGVHIAE